MTYRKKIPQQLRTPVETETPDPRQGLSLQQVEVRKAGGWENKAPADALRSETEILLQHCFTFFNLVFLVLAAVLDIDEGYAALGSIGGVAVYYLLLWLFGGRISEKVNFTISKIIK